MLKVDNNSCNFLFLRNSKSLRETGISKECFFIVASKARGAKDSELETEFSDEEYFEN